MPFHFQPFVGQIAPTLATLPNLSSDLSKPAAPAVVLTYTRPDYVNQIRPTLSTIAGGAAIGLSLDSRSSNPPRFSVPEQFSAPPKFGLIVAAAPTPDSWTSTLGQKSVILNYTAPDFVKPVLPLGFVQPVFSWMSPLSTYSGVRKSYARSVADTGVNVNPATITLIHWTPTIGSNAVVLNYARADQFVAPTRFGLIVAATVFLPSRHSDPPPTYVGTFASTDFVNQVAPPLPVTIGIVWLPTTGVFTNSRSYARQVANVGMGVKFSPTINVAGWTGTDGRNAVVLNYSDGDIFTSPDKFGQIVVVPPTIAGWLGTIGQNAVVNNFVNSLWNAPDKFNLVTISPATISGWTSTAGQNAVTLRYASSDYVNQVRQTLVNLPLLVQGLTEIPRSAFSQFAQADRFSAPDKFNIQTVPIISGWLGTDGQRALILNYVQPDFVSQYRPTLVLTSLGFLSYDIIKAQPQSFTLPSWSAPDKFGIVVVAPALISGWSSTEGKQAVQLKYAASDWSAPAKFGLIQAAVVFLPGWSAVEGKNAVQLHYALSNWIAPEKMTGIVVVVPLYSWRGEDGYFPKFDWFSMGDTSTGPANVAGVSQAYSSAVEGQNALVLRYASTQLSAPDKFGLITPVTATLAGWSSTAGVKSVLLQYALPDWISPPKFGLIAIAPPTISSWTSTIGQNAVVLPHATTDYVNQIQPTLATLPNGIATDFTVWNRVGNPPTFQQGDTWSAPSKFGIIVPSAITISNWTPTIGQNAVVLKYALSDYVNQIRPTLATLPVLLYGISEPGVNAQPQKFVASLFDAPSKFNLPFISMSGWFGTDGQKAVLLSYAPTDWVAPAKLNLQFTSISGWLSTDGKNAVVLNHASTDWSAPAKFGIITPAPITIANWFGTDGKNAVVLKYAPPDYVNQVAPTLALLPSSASFLNFIGPKAQPQLFAATDYVNQIYPTLTPLPNGVGTDFTVWNRPSNPPTFSLGDIFTGPPTFNLPFIPGSILVRGVVFYKVVTSYNVIVNGKVMNIVLVQ
jgi:hypothetical protein